MQMIDGGSRAFGADDVAGVFYAGKRIRKLRFLMTDNIRRRLKIKIDEMYKVIPWEIT